MKRLKFKKPFKGEKNVKKLIPEGYKKNNNIFEMTDGNETYKIRWEDKTPVILEYINQEDVNADLNKMKHLFEYNPRETFGNIKGKERIEENERFNDFINKTKALMTEEKEEDTDDVIKEHDNETLNISNKKKLNKKPKESDPGEEETGGSQAKGDADEYVEDKDGKKLSSDKPKEVEPASGIRENEYPEDLSEMDLDEWFGDFEKKREKAKQKIQSESRLKRQYEKFKNEDPKKAEAYIDFIAKNLNSKYFSGVWDASKGKFVTKSGGRLGSPTAN